MSLRLGFRMINGLSQSHAELIVQAREDVLFTSFQDFTRRTRLSNAVLSKLSKADAFASLNLNRREALWMSLPTQQTLPLLESRPLADRVGNKGPRHRGSIVGIRDRAGNEIPRNQ